MHRAPVRRSRDIAREREVSMHAEKGEGRGETRAKAQRPKGNSPQEPHRLTVRMDLRIAYV